MIEKAQASCPSGTQESQIRLGTGHLNYIQAARWRSSICSSPSPGRLVSQNHIISPTILSRSLAPFLGLTRRSLTSD